MTPKDDLYHVLGVPRTATAAVITKAYRKRAAKLHPDRNPGDDAARDQYVRVVFAYEVLSDPIRRERYDQTGNVDSVRTTEDGEFLAHVMPLILGAIAQAETIHGGVERVDIIAQARDRLTGERRKTRADVAKLNQAVKAVRTAAGRLSVSEGANLLSEAMGTHVREIEAEIDRLNSIEARIDRAIATLLRYRYQSTPSPGSTSGMFLVAGWTT